MVPNLCTRMEWAPGRRNRSIFLGPTGGLSYLILLCRGKRWRIKLQIQRPLSQFRKHFVWKFQCLFLSDYFTLINLKNFVMAKKNSNKSGKPGSHEKKK